MQFYNFQKSSSRKEIDRVWGSKVLDLHPDKIISRLGAVDAALAI